MPLAWIAGAFLLSMAGGYAAGAPGRGARAGRRSRRGAGAGRGLPPVRSGHSGVRGRVKE